jgi:hypothetical protein
MASPMLYPREGGPVIPDFFDTYIFAEGPMAPGLQQTTEALGRFVARCINDFSQLLGPYLRAVHSKRSLLDANTWLIPDPQEARPSVNEGAAESAACNEAASGQDTSGGASGAGPQGS